MPGQPRDRESITQILTARPMRRAIVRALAGARSVSRGVVRSLSFVLQVIAALILLFEEWGWQPLVDALAWLSRFRVFARIETAIAGLPPYGALVALAIPTAILFPLKLLAVYLITSGQIFAAGLLFVGAKIASTALIARLFLLTQPKLMQIGWFASIYNFIMPWKDALFNRIRASWVWRYARMLKTRARLELKQAWLHLKPVAEQFVAGVRGAFRRIWKRA